MNDIGTIVSENIKKLLDEYNLNQNELAKIAGVSESTVGKWVLKKSAPRMGAIEKIAEHFNLPKSYILEEEKHSIVKESQYPYYDISISAGSPITVDGITETESIMIPDSIMGKHAGSRDIKIMRVNGESMNRIIPHHSLIAVKPLDIQNIKDGDIVVYCDDNEYSVKRIFKAGDKIIFRPDSTDNSFTDYVANVDEKLCVIGKVVLYIVELD